MHYLENNVIAVVRMHYSTQEHASPDGISVLHSCVFANYYIGTEEEVFERNIELQCMN